MLAIINARLLRVADLQIAHIGQAYLETVSILANTIEGRDPYTYGHVERVTKYARWMGEALGWPANKMRGLEFGARLHDVGKIVVPDRVLKKPGPLSKEEWSLMQQHPAGGCKKSSAKLSCSERLFRIFFATMKNGMAQAILTG
ncbi:MAG: HD domain-containing protein [Anaerolineae bacterium]|nr:HD domain-containing protein [Anaerolineae bacterium]